MSRVLIGLSAMLVLVRSLSAQPMSGNFTIGGTSPDFAELQDAALALKVRGVSGPVFFNIRPGTYMRNGGNNSVLRLDTLVAGVSATNRITFQPDAAAGGNVDNVILQINRINPPTADADLVVVRLDFVTLRNLTLQDIDSSHTFNNHLIRLLQLDSRNPVIDGFVLEGCKLVGTPFIQSGSTVLGTDFGLGSIQNVADLTIRGNTFVRLLRAISIVNGSAVAPTTITIEDNQIVSGYRSMSGSGNLLGAGIEVASSQLIVRRNVVDFVNTHNGGWKGIQVIGPVTAEIEQNVVRGLSAHAMFVATSSSTVPASILIANNMITSGNTNLGQFTNYGLRSEVSNATIAHNSIVVPGGTVNAMGLSVIGQNCTVLNNIVMNLAAGAFLPFVVSYELGSPTVTPNLRTDHNIFYKLSAVGGPAVMHGSTQYPSLTAFQSATGFDTNSVFRSIDFLNLTSDLHLTDCQAQDADLRGIPVPGIAEDFDGDVRSLTTPTRGADEAAFRAVPMFGDVFRMPMPGFITDIAAGRFDNLFVDGLAVADYDNSQIRLYHNNPSSRSFVLSQTLSPGFRPMHVKLFDLDHDGNPDVVVSGDTSLVKVYWGDGGGGFPSDSTIRVGFFSAQTADAWPVVALDTGRVTSLSGPNLHTIILSAGLRSMPVTNFLGYLDNSNGRSVRFRFVVRPIPSPAGSVPDSIAGILRDLVGVDIDGNGDPEVGSILASGLVADFVAFNDTNAQGGGGFTTFGTHYNYSFGTASYMPTSSIISGRFDNDGDVDLITTAASTDQILFLRNQGNFGFSPEPIPVNSGRGLASLDYDNDGDQDFVTVNLPLADNGITVFLNDGTGNFAPEFNCFQGYASGLPRGVLASDLDLDGRTDLAIAAAPDTVFVLYNFGGGINNVHGDYPAGIPSGFRLEQNYPNPFNPATNFQFAVARSELTTLKVYDLLGREVSTIVNEVLPPGNYTRRWDASSVASGVYFYRLVAGEASMTLKMLVIR